MLAQSPKDRSRSPHRTNGISGNNQKKTSLSSSPSRSNINDTSSQDEINNKSKKDNDSQIRMKTLKTFIQTLANDSSSLGSSYDEQIKTLENACSKEFQDLSIDRIRRMIRNIYKSRKSHHQDHSDRFNSNESNSKKNRSNSISTNTSSTKSSDLIPPSTSSLSALDTDFLRHAFSQQFRPAIDLSAYFSATSNNSPSTSSLFRPDFSPSNFLQSLTAPPPPPPPHVSSHTHTNGSYQRNTDSSSITNTKLSKQMKLSTNEINSIKVLINAYREAASYLNRSADELEQLV